MAFEPPKDYVDVAARITEFRAKYPEGTLAPWDQAKPFEIIRMLEGVTKDGKTIEQTFIVVVAAARRTPDDTSPGVGMAWEVFPGRTPYTLGSELMNAETSAWGRAIIAVGAADSKKGIASAEEVRNRAAERDDQADRGTDWMPPANPHTPQSRTPQRPPQRPPPRRPIHRHPRRRNHTRHQRPRPATQNRNTPHQQRHHRPRRQTRLLLPIRQPPHHHQRRTLLPRSRRNHPPRRKPPRHPRTPRREAMSGWGVLKPGKEEHACNTCSCTCENCQAGCGWDCNCPDYYAPEETTNDHG
jgi:hypothetical protein